jgi:hypothetical protein
LKVISKINSSRLIDLLLSLPLVGYIFWSNTLLSNSFEQMPLRAIDDLAMQSSIHLSLLNIAQGDFSQILYKFDYAYGWLFWSLYQLWVSPFALIFHLMPNQATEKLLIVMAREFTLFILILTLIMIRRIVSNLFLNLPVFGSPVIKSLVTFIILLNPIVGYWSGRVQPPILSTFFFICSIWILTKNQLKSSYISNLVKRMKCKLDAEEILSFLFLGCAIGIKPNFALCIGVYIYFYILIKGNFNLKQFGWKVFASIFGFIFGASPGILLNPNLYLIQYLNTLLDLSEMSMNYSDTNRTIVESIKLSLESNLLGVTGTLFVLSVFLIALKLSKNQFNLLLGHMFGMLVFIAPMAYVGMNFEDKSLVGSYLLPLLILFPIFLIRLFLDLNSIRLRAIAMSVMTILIFSNFLSTLDSVEKRTYYSVNSWQVQNHLVRSEGKIREQNQLKELIPLQSDVTQQIFLDYEVPSPWSNYREGIEVDYVFDNWNQFEPTANVDMVWLLLDIEKKENAEANFMKLDKDRNVNVAESLQRSQVALNDILLNGVFGQFKCEDFKTLKFTHVFRCEPF